MDISKMKAGLNKLRKEHYTCVDPWYNCPASSEGSARDDAGTECECGADEHNALVDALLIELG